MVTGISRRCRRSRAGWWCPAMPRHWRYSISTATAGRTSWSRGTAKRRWRFATGASRAGIPFVLSCRGSLENPQAVGARVTAEYADGTTQTGEVCAGSGYYSQSTAALFFGFTDRNPLRRVRVQWPSGATTTSPIGQTRFPRPSGWSRCLVAGDSLIGQRWRTRRSALHAGVSLDLEGAAPSAPRILPKRRR